MYYRLCPPKLPEPSGAVHSIWWLGFFLTSSPILDLEHFSQVILRIVLQIMPPPNYPNHQVLFTASDGWGLFFFDLFSYSGLRAFFTSDLTNCTTDYAHPPKEPKPSGAVLRIWWLGFFLDLFSYSGLRAFFTSDLRIVLQIMPPPQINPTIRCCSQHLMVGGFFLTSFPILDVEHFSQMILWIVLQIMPPQITPTIRCCSQHLMVRFFFDLFSYSGLRAFFTSDFTNCTTDYAHPTK